jgi:DNA-binding MarR family transcriptional regulator
MSAKPRKLAPTATRKALLASGSDRLFRELLYNFFTVAIRLETLRRYLGSRIEISGPQYTLTMAVAEMEGSTGVSVGQVARYLHVSGTFVTAQSAKLAKKGYLKILPDPRDKRISRLFVGDKGWIALRSLFPELQQLNDELFAFASQTEFQRFHATVKKMVNSSGRTLARLNL